MTLQTTHRTQQVFNSTAATYDADRARLIPGHDRFYAWAVELIPPDSQRILDLGAGSGALTIFVRKSFPAADIHLIDFSAPMLALAKSRLGEDPRLTYEVADYTVAPLPENLDAIVSALSIHHLEDDAKRALFHKIHAALKPGGVFINAEQVLGPTPALEARYKKLWLTQVRILGATEQQIADSLYRQQDDRCATVADQLQWLRVAGFADADCWFKDNRFAVLAGRRAS
ncbi:MAG: methyltransferase domain-containing protein [Acidobacteriaceae bacterium]